MRHSDRMNLLIRDDYYDWVPANERMAMVMADKGGIASSGLTTNLT